MAAHRAALSSEVLAGCPWPRRAGGLQGNAPSRAFLLPSPCSRRAARTAARCASSQPRDAAPDQQGLLAAALRASSGLALSAILVTSAPALAWSPAAHADALLAADAAPLVGAVATLADAPKPDLPDPASNPYIKELLERSKANKEKNDKERLEDYNRRNFKDYMDFLGGSLQARKAQDLTDNDKAILEWIKKNS